jgi:hypothetical protein
MNKNVATVLTIFSFVAGYYLVSSVSAGDVDIPIIVHDSVPHHQAPLDVPMGEHVPLLAPHVPLLAPVDGIVPCPTIDAHRTDLPLDVPTGAPLLDVPADAPQAERDKMKDYLEHTSPRAPMTGNFDCGTPAS